jgi:hypothetical protein
MRNELPKKAWRKETAVVNLSNDKSNGTHWVAYWKYGKEIYYFDSFGNLQPTKEIVKYLGKNVKYNYETEQQFNTVNCGHLCINFIINYYIKLFNK